MPTKSHRESFVLHEFDKNCQPAVSSNYSTTISRGPKPAPSFAVPSTACNICAVLTRGFYACYSKPYRKRATQAKPREKTFLCRSLTHTQRLRLGSILADGNRKILQGDRSLSSCSSQVSRKGFPARLRLSAVQSNFLRQFRPSAGLPLFLL